MEADVAYELTEPRNLVMLRPYPKTYDTRKANADERKDFAECIVPVLAT
jgi:hypothetical protein